MFGVYGPFRAENTEDEERRAAETVWTKKKKLFTAAHVARCGGAFPATTAANSACARPPSLPHTQLRVCGCRRRVRVMAALVLAGRPTTLQGSLTDTSGLQDLKMMCVYVCQMV